MASPAADGELPGASSWGTYARILRDWFVSAQPHGVEIFDTRDQLKALCLKLGQTKDRSRPLAGMCDSARCPQATHHPCHRPVWASAAASSRVFIGKIGRSRKAEKSRLTAEAERAEHVVAAIDASLAAATGGVHGQDQ